MSKQVDVKLREFNRAMEAARKCIMDRVPSGKVKKKAVKAEWVLESEILNDTWGHIK